MKRFNHKLVLFFVVVCLTLSLSCFFAGARDMTFTDGIYTYTLANNTLTVTDVDTSASGDVVIPSSVEGYPVVGIDPHSFRGCKDIVSVTIPDSVTTIGLYGFFECSSLTSVTIPESVTSIGEKAFAYCSDLNSITIGKNISEIGVAAFAYCTNLENIFVDSENEYFTVDENGILFNIDKTLLIKCPQANGISSYTVPDSVKRIDDNAFYGCKNLTEIIIGDNMIEIGYDTFKDSAYYNDADNWENGVLYIGKHLIEAKNVNSCKIKEGTISLADQSFFRTELTSIKIPDSVILIGNLAFFESDIKNITFGKGLQKIGYNAFKDCGNLTSVILPDGITSIGAYAFCYCGNIQTLILGKSLTEIGKGAFFACQGIKSVVIPDTVITIGYNAFRDCTNLSDITIGSSVQSIGEYAFADCRALETIFIPGSVTEISRGLFDECPCLKAIGIGVGVKTIAEGVIPFFGCSLFYGGTKEQWDEVDYKGANKKTPYFTHPVPYHSYTNYIPDGNASYFYEGTKTAECDYGCGKKETATGDISNYVLGKTSKITVTPTETTATLTWEPVEGATGYRVYYYDGGWKKINSTKTTSYTVKGLKAATKYNFAVKAYATGVVCPEGTLSSFESTRWAPEYTTVETTTLFTKVTKVTATQSENAIKLSWNAVPGATGYRVYSYNRATGKYTTLSTIQKTSGTHKNLKSGTEYNYLVRAYKKLADGTVAWASYSKDDIFVTGTIPAKATAITATQSTSAIKLTWKEKGGATGYCVYEYNKTTGKYTKLGTVQKLNGTIKNLKAGTTYGYLVRAYTQLSDGTVLWADYSKNDVFYTATKAVAPTLKATAGTKKFTLSWNKVAGATSYEVWYSTSANGTYKKLTTVTGTTYSKSCTTGKTYYFKVRAMKAVDGQNIKGEASAAKGVTIK